MGLPGCLFVCHLILLLMCFLFNNILVNCLYISYILYIYYVVCCKLKM